MLTGPLSRYVLIVRVAGAASGLASGECAVLLPPHAHSTAHKKVFVESQEFWGRSNTVKYDQGKELLILEGGENGTATLYRTKVQAGQQNMVTGKKIFYYRKTNQVHMEEGHRIVFD